jgi:GNAT superfamily N-acetyltransferase
MGFHPEGFGKDPTPEKNRANKELRVRNGDAHAALAYEGDTCVGWCQFGAPDELPRIKNRKAYLAGLDELPDWRITCFFVDRHQRGHGVATAALAGALEQIADLGGGVVESYPDDIGDRRTSGGFIHNGTIAMFERLGFTRVRPIGKNRWVVRRTIVTPGGPGPGAG